jgi:Rod binding domain-containing protein
MIDDVTRMPPPIGLPGSPVKRADSAQDSPAGQDVQAFKDSLVGAIDEIKRQASGEETEDPTGVSAKEAEKIDKTARDMESLLLYTMLKQMWETLPKDAFFDSGLSTQFFREMYLEEISKRVSSTGDGIGVAKVIREELMDQAKRTLTPEQMQMLDQLKSSIKTDSAVTGQASQTGLLSDGGESGPLPL